MTEERYIKNKDTGVVFRYTELLAVKKDMVECNLDGDTVFVQEAKAESAAPKKRGRKKKEVAEPIVEIEPKEEKEEVSE